MFLPAIPIYQVTRALSGDTSPEFLVSRTPELGFGQTCERLSTVESTIQYSEQTFVPIKGADNSFIDTNLKVLFMQ